MKTQTKIHTLNFLGGSIDQAIKQAKIRAIETRGVVEFDFNDIRCLVNTQTNTDLLQRDYFTALKLGWSEIGPHPLDEYTPELQTQIAQKEREIEVKNEAARRQQAERNAACRNAFMAKTAGIELELLDPTLFETWKAQNTDPYGACIFEYAESWAKLMQHEMSLGKALADCAGDTSFQLGYLGITGYMYGAAVNILTLTWKHGEALRNWHNGKYGHTGEGVVNPAVLTIAK